MQVGCKLYIFFLLDVHVTEQPIFIHLRWGKGSFNVHFRVARSQKDLFLLGRRNPENAKKMHTSKHHTDSNLSSWITWELKCSSIEVFLNFAAVEQQTTYEDNHVFKKENESKEEITFKHRTYLSPGCDPSFTGVLAQWCLEEKYRDSAEDEEDKVRDEEYPYRNESEPGITFADLVLL